MKTKAFALILCIILCFSVLMVGCQKECTEHVDADNNAKCDNCDANTCVEHKDQNDDTVCDYCKAAMPASCEHADANANGYCDNCKGAIIGIHHTTVTEPGKRVEMVVNDIPTNVALGSYTDSYDPNRYGSVVKINLLNSLYGYTYECIENGDYDNHEYRIKSVITGETIFRITENYELELYDSDGLLYVSGYDATAEEYEYSYYSYTGLRLYNHTGNFAPEYYADNNENGWNYINIDGKAYVVDGETYKVIAIDLDPATLVKRPAFDAESDKYGYIFDEGTVYVYDRAKVAECVYSYDVPSYYQDVKFMTLENGNVLIQAITVLGDDAVSYDFFEEGNKYDIVYDMIDPVAKAVKRIEFGYYIISLYQPEGNGIYNDKALNVAAVYSIVNDRVDTCANKIMVVDNDMKVLFELTQIVDKTVYSVAPVANDVYQVIYEINEAYIKELIDANGKHITYLADEAYIYAGMIAYGDKLYDLDMNLAFDGYTVEYTFDDYIILSKYNEETFETEYFRYSGNRAMLIENFVYAYEFGYVVEDIDSEQYHMYNRDGSYMGSIDGYAYYYEQIADGIYGFSYGGEYYVVR